MDKEIRVIFIPVDGEMELKVVNGDYTQYQELVGGYVRVIEHVLVDCTLCVDEEALFKNKRINFRASNLIGNAIYGDTVLTNLGMISDDERDFVSLDDKDIIKLMIELRVLSIKGFSLDSLVNSESVKGHQVFVIGSMGTDSELRQLANVIIQGKMKGFSIGASVEFPKEVPELTMKDFVKEFKEQKILDETHPFKAFGGSSKKDLNQYRGHRRKK